MELHCIHCTAHSFVTKANGKCHYMTAEFRSKHQKKKNAFALMVSTFVVKLVANSSKCIRLEEKLAEESYLRDFLSQSDDNGVKI